MMAKVGRHFQKGCVFFKKENMLLYYIIICALFKSFSSSPFYKEFMYIKDGTFYTKTFEKGQRFLSNQISKSHISKARHCSFLANELDSLFAADAILTAYYGKSAAQARNLKKKKNHPIKLNHSKKFTIQSYTVLLSKIHIQKW